MWPMFVSLSIYWGRGCIKELFGLSLCKQKKAGKQAVWLDFL